MGGQRLVRPGNELSQIGIEVSARGTGCRIGIRWLSLYFPTLHQLSIGLLFLAPCRIDLHLVIGKTPSHGGRSLELWHRGE